jgi:hypothetical protein
MSACAPPPRLMSLSTMIAVDLAKTPAAVVVLDV